MRLTILFLFLSSVCFGQLGPAQSGLFYNTGIEQKPLLVFEDNTSTYSVKADEISTRAVAPRLLWKNGQTHYVYVDPATQSGRVYILTYDDSYGIGRPIGYGRVVAADGHHRPAIISYSDTLMIVAEHSHNTSPLRLFKGQVGDAMIFDKQAGLFGTAPTYVGLSVKNGIFTILNQTNDVLAAYNKNTTGVFGGTWSNEINIGVRQTDEDELYTFMPANNDQLPNEVVWVLMGNNDDTSPQTAFNRYVFKTEITAAGDVTLYNWDKSFSRPDGSISASNMLNYRYYTTGSDVINSFVPTPALDLQGNFYDVAGDGSGGYRFLYFVTGQSSVTDKALTLPGSPTLVERNANQGACMSVLAISPKEIYTFWSVDEGGFDHVYMYRTTDLGDTWTFVDDVFDDISADINFITIPHNALHIPNNRNFIVVGLGTGDPTPPLYIKRAAFGEIQTNDTQNLYDNYTAYTESEYDALMLRSYYIEAGKITNTGTTLNSCIDQSPSAQDATSVGSPVIDNATTPTFLAFDGTNDRLDIPTTGLLALEQGTVIMVVKSTQNTGAFFTTFSRNGSSTPFMSLGNTTGNLTRWQDQNGQVAGSTTLSDQFHIIAWTFQNGNCAVLHFLDGELQFRTEVTPHTGEGQFTQAYSTMDRVSIGGAVRNSNFFYDFDFKHFAMTSTPMTQEQLAKAFKYLANKYSITLTDHYD